MKPRVFKVSGQPTFDAPMGSIASGPDGQAWFNETGRRGGWVKK